MALAASARIPQELFKSILIYVGEDDRLFGHYGLRIDTKIRREQMQHLSACSLTCFYWAKFTRAHMFKMLILRSPQDVRDLRALLHFSSSQRLAPIGNYLWHLVVEYHFNNYFWLYNLRGLLQDWTRRAPAGQSFHEVDIHVSGPAPAITTALGRRTVRHPLFHSLPRIIPMPFIDADVVVYLFLDDVHFADHAGLQNLIQDLNFRGLIAKDIYCRNLSWDDQAQSTPPSLVSTDIAHHSLVLLGPAVICSGSTDDVLAALVVFNSSSNTLMRAKKSISALDIPDYGHLVNIARALYDAARASGVCAPGCYEISIEGHEYLTCVPQKFWSYGDKHNGIPSSELSFAIRGWSDDSPRPVPLGVASFGCLAYPNPTTMTYRTAHVYCFIIELSNEATPFGNSVEVCHRAFDWTAFCDSLLQFPKLSCVVIRSWRYSALAKFVEGLKEALLPVEHLLELYYWAHGVSWQRIDFEELEDIGGPISLWPDQ
ncbi:hypothetical protein BDY19DRAFT_967000 [Irpex rosettiformis]|uniref:Uncharacterized protein n=1 Tax=Irpex rosettiformis TaxID=378272 RepID=A0ACB8TT75_9APHY|nr:hypothetical protein BDY19DRAFT_967000 [Irpex rosettiformis]